jgi:hypothetical protein
MKLWEQAFIFGLLFSILSNTSESPLARFVLEVVAFVFLITGVVVNLKEQNK